mmetsp:Transcript_26420/g.43255  ORF Transcript_26420/g.43255 Transcript_26420/m.43255 type:complete len:150 (+) Transcript_26420:210-659(+)
MYACPLLKIYHVPFHHFILQRIISSQTQTSHLRSSYVDQGARSRSNDEDEVIFTTDMEPTFKSCVNKCKELDTTKTGRECRSECMGNERSTGNERSGNERSTGPGKTHTIAPSPTPPTRAHLVCMHECVLAGGSEAECRDECPLQFASA